jgi:hypothetical protein
MRDVMPRTIILVALILAGLGAVVACAAPQAQTPPEKEVEFTRGQKVKVVEVKQGERIRFIAANLTVFIVIPDNRLQKGHGCEDWTSTASYVAFKIDRGNATVLVPEDYPASESGTSIWYSVMARDGAEWDYLHGENPPPRMIIRGR